MAVSPFTPKQGYWERLRYVEPMTWEGRDFNGPVNGSLPQDPATDAFSRKDNGVGGSWKEPIRKPYTREFGNLRTHTPATVRVFETKPYSDVTYRTPDIGGFPTWPDRENLLQNCLDRSLNEALLKLRGDRSSLGADLAEGKQTVEMIAGDSMSVLQAYKAARQGQWGRIPGILGMSRGDVISGKGLANRWLEYKYGWQPLLKGIEENHKLLPSQLRKRNATMKVHATAGDSWQDEVNRYANLGTEYKYLFSERVSARTEYEFRVQNSIIDRIDAAGLLNPLSIAWELVPFSFVLDWFIPVGNTLAAITATAGLQFVSGSSSMKRSWSVVRSRHDLPRNPFATGYSEVLNPGSTSWEGRSFGRIVHSSFQPPKLYANTSPFSSTRTLNALALLRQLL